MQSIILRLIALPDTPEIPTAVRAKFDKLNKDTIKNKNKTRPRIKINQFVRKDIIAIVNTLLQETFDKIEGKQLFEIISRKYKKAAIYAAGVLLTRESKREKIKPLCYVYTEKRAKKLKNRIERAKKLQSWTDSKRLQKSLKNQAREIRRLKMTTAEYIILIQERLQALQYKIDVQRAIAKALGVRENFEKRPISAIIKQREERKLPDLAKTEQYFKNTYGKNQEEKMEDTPLFDTWLTRMRQYRETIDTECQLQISYVVNKIISPEFVCFLEVVRNRWYSSRNL